MKRIYEFLSYTPKTTGLTPAPWDPLALHSGKGTTTTATSSTQIPLCSGWAQVQRCASLRDPRITAPQGWGPEDEQG